MLIGVNWVKSAPQIEKLYKRILFEMLIFQNSSDFN